MGIELDCNPKFGMQYLALKLWRVPFGIKGYKISEKWTVYYDYRRKIGSEVRKDQISLIRLDEPARPHLDLSDEKIITCVTLVIEVINNSGIW